MGLGRFQLREPETERVALTKAVSGHLHHYTPLSIPITGLTLRLAAEYYLWRLVGIAYLANPGAMLLNAFVLGQQGDVFLGISTSGNSKNVIKALKLSKIVGITTLGFIGADGGTMRDLCDYSIVIPSNTTMNIQECHLALEPIFCMVVERCCFCEGFGENLRS